MEERIKIDWRPIETAPKDGTEIILAAKFLNMCDIGICYWRDDDDFGSGWTWGLGERFNGATHWVPLPEDPK